ncbi:MAG: L,D-transpeptidase [Hyphomicrobiales bacterium]|nr:L,D-transpeptidase [Hyphomicrobiales bacterium]MDE2017113.1 L,D-transpeptidase [Hyphomicrobiales bacterium]
MSKSPFAALIAGSALLLAAAGPAAAWTDVPGLGQPYNVPPGATSTPDAPAVSVIPPQEVTYSGPYSPGTIYVSTTERRLYYVLPGHKAIKYAVGVGRPGFTWAGSHTIVNKRIWPDWTPPAQMLLRQKGLPKHMAGGPDNPLGARALYIGGTLYRIHGTSQPETIGQAMSSGCIRMMNQDVKDLYARVKVGSPVIVR